MYKIQSLDKTRSTEAINFVCTEFVANSVLHSTLNVALNGYIDYISNSLLSLINEGMSLIAIDEATNSIVGCILAGEFVPTALADDSTPKFAKPIKALLHSLESSYVKNRNITKGSVLLVDIAVVSPKASGQGIYTKLRKEVQQLAKSKGYTHVIGELSSAITQYVCVEKMGHTLICEIPYKTFEYNGDYPFASIEEPASIQLVEAVLD